MSENLEHCSLCGEPTGHAGAAEDSVFVETNGHKIGPLCHACLDGIRQWVKDDCGCCDSALTQRDVKIRSLKDELVDLHQIRRDRDQRIATQDEEIAGLRSHHHDAELAFDLHTKTQTENEQLKEQIAALTADLSDERQQHELAEQSADQNFKTARTLTAELAQAKGRAGKLEKAEFREALADLCHRQWAHWMRYLFSKTKTTPSGSSMIRADLSLRWQRQMVTDYADLTEKEKKSDREQAGQFVTLILAPQPPAEAKEG